MTEQELLTAIIGSSKQQGLCGELGIRWFHVFDSRASPGGFPDLVLAGRRAMLFAELKGAITRVTPKQREWGRDITRAGGYWVVWRPGDLHSGRIKKELEAITR